MPASQRMQTTAGALAAIFGAFGSLSASRSLADDAMPITGGAPATERLAPAAATLGTRAG